VVVVKAAVETGVGVDLEESRMELVVEAAKEKVGLLAVLLVEEAAEVETHALASEVVAVVAKVEPICHSRRCNSIGPIRQI
jgi:hypothetical protein